MIQPFIETLDKFMVTPYETGEIRPITWWWCDALFMAPPAYVKLGISLKDNKYLELNDKLFKECYDLLYDKEHHLYARDMKYKWDEPGITPIKEANGEKIFWSRGNGWVMGGLVRTIEELPKDYKNRDFYIQNYKEMAEKNSCDFNRKMVFGVQVYLIRLHIPAAKPVDQDFIFMHLHGELTTEF
jgi:unsaturated rhamnogalacturonyl hydrolase